MELEHETLNIEREFGRIKKVSRFITVVCSIFSVFVLVAIVAAFACFVYEGLGGGGLPYVLSAKALLYAIPYSILTLVFLRIVLNIFKAVVAGESPFRKEQARRIRWLSYLLFIKAALEALLTIGMSTLAQIGPFYVTYVDNTVNGGLVSIDGEAIFMGLLILSLSFVFDYGSLLQKYTDETA